MNKSKNDSIRDVFLNTHSFYKKNNEFWRHSVATSDWDYIDSTTLLDFTDTNKRNEYSRVSVTLNMSEEIPYVSASLFISSGESDINSPRVVGLIDKFWRFAQDFAEEFIRRAREKGYEVQPSNKVYFVTTNETDETPVWFFPDYIEVGHIGNKTKMSDRPILTVPVLSAQWF